MRFSAVWLVIAVLAVPAAAFAAGNDDIYSRTGVGEGSFASVEPPPQTLGQVVRPMQAMDAPINAPMDVRAAAPMQQAAPVVSSPPSHAAPIDLTRTPNYAVNGEVTSMQPYAGYPNNVYVQNNQPFQFPNPFANRAPQPGSVAGQPRTTIQRDRNFTFVAPVQSTPQDQDNSIANGYPSNYYDAAVHAGDPQLRYHELNVRRAYQQGARDYTGY